MSFNYIKNYFDRVVEKGVPPPYMLIFSLSPWLPSNISPGTGCYQSSFATGIGVLLSPVWGSTPPVVTLGPIPPVSGGHIANPSHQSATRYEV